MSLSESDTRAKLIDPALHARGWTEDLTRREETAGTIEIVGGNTRRRTSGRVDYSVKVNPASQPVTVALIEGKAEHLSPTHGLEQGKLYADGKRLNVPFDFATNGHRFVLFNRFTGQTTSPASITEFLTPDSLLTRYEVGMGFDLTDPAARPLLTPYPKRRIAGLLTEQMAETDRARMAAEEQMATAKDLVPAQLRATFDHDENSGWRKVRLGDVLQLRKEVVHPRDRPCGPATFVGLKHIESHTGSRTGSVAIEMEKLTGRKPRFHDGDIVNGYLRPYLNKVWLADFGGLCSVDHYVFSVARDRADTSYIAWFMRSPTYLERAHINTTPGQVPRIRTDEVASIEIRLPPISKQNRIARQLDAQLKSVDKLRRSTATQLDAINRLPAAFLRRAFSGEL